MASPGLHRSRRFVGWPPESFDLLLRLEGDPSPSLRESLRRDRERLVRQPMIALLQDVADADPAYDDFSVWGFGKTVWWWQHQSSAVRIERGVELGVRLDVDGLAVAGNGWFVDPGKLQLFRAAAAADDTGDRLEGMLAHLVAHGWAPGGDLLRRAPRGYRPEHPRAHLLRHRSLSVTRLLDSEPWLHGDEGVDRVLAGFAELRPLMEWLSDNVGSGAVNGA
jgi:Conserved hypothetical protein (DUF2461)